jgi:hypothetical protein
MARKVVTPVGGPGIDQAVQAVIYQTINFLDIIIAIKIIILIKICRHGVLELMNKGYI